jgi:hypothetical protein
MMVDGKGYNGQPMEDIMAAGGCPKGNINALKDGVVTRGILFDATRLPGKTGPQGWLEPRTGIHRGDLEVLEKLERVKVSAVDVILLYWALGRTPPGSRVITPMSRSSSKTAAFPPSGATDRTTSHPPAFHRRSQTRCIAWRWLPWG